MGALIYIASVLYSVKNIHITVCVYAVCRERERHERERERELEDEEEAYERRKLEKKLREKEAGYQEVGDSSERLVRSVSG